MTCTAIIVQARMNSTRLPGKTMALIAGRPMLWHVVTRLRHVRAADQLVVATTTDPADDQIAAFCAAEGVACTRGPEHDVLARYHEAALAVDATAVVRVTSDCPLIFPALVDQAITTFYERGCDYLSNMLQPTYPYGLAVEVFTWAALHEAHAEATDPAEREHVTPFLYWRPERYQLSSLAMSPDLSHHRWTVDTPEDLELVRNILVAQRDRPAHNIGLDDVLMFLAEQPHLAALNRHIEQRVPTATPRRTP